MMLVLSCFGLISLAELLLWWQPCWRHRKIFAYILVVLLAVLNGSLLAELLSTWTVLLAMASLYAMINLLRVIQSRVQADYLFYSTRLTAFCLIGLQLIVLGCGLLNNLIQLNILTWWYLLAAGQLVAAVVLLASTLRHLRTTYPSVLTDDFSDRDLPALTVAIPARNESEDLTACLQSLIASNYPKLEILVLDDCSQDRHTPEIIRSFAHDGVRFLAGTPPPGQWLAKNHAYAQLAAEANGELLLFCGVDVRFEPQSLTQLVKTMLQKQKSMVSVLPRNIMPTRASILHLLLQPNRYAWEIALPRRLLSRPPVLSTCWIIRRAALEAAGGFQAVSRKGVPESYLARVTAAQSDGYSFLQSNAAMGISCQKNLSDQRETAVRTRYLQLHRRPELVFLVGLAEFTILVWPLIMLVAAVVAQAWALALLSATSFATTTYLQSRIINLTYRSFVLRGILILPFAAVYDIGLLNYSMWQYEFNQVLWKGRNVCVPVMRVIPPHQFTEDLA